MDEVFCGLSALRHVRVPPAIKAAYPPVSLHGYGYGGAWSAEDHFIVDNIGFPLHLLAASRAGRTGARGIKWHLVSGDLPFGSIIEDEDLDVRTTSPLMTLFTLGSQISDAHLLMAMYEFCGRFALFRPASHIEERLEREVPQPSLGAPGGWVCVCDVSGRPSDMWKRPPLIEVHELRQFAREVEHLRGGKRFARLVAKVAGVTASPFEVQTSMLLGLSRAQGGEGLDGFSNNHEIRLTHGAQRIAGKGRVYADLYFEGAEGGPPLVIECQGGMVHGGEAAVLSDADRTAALQAMGIDVLALTYKQIADRDNFNRIARLIAAKLGRPYREKSARLRAKEAELRRELFIDWLTLGE